MTKIVLALAAGASLLVGVTAAQAESRPSWCRSQGSLNLAEQTVCDTPRLWGLDYQLNIIYRGALSSVGSQRGRLEASELDWLRVTRNGCNADDSCLDDVYARRIDVLRRIDNRGYMNPNE
jgi:uncharacterized protein